ncbi:MAG TPA: hypothetical protein VFR86_07160, partial [Burkholderiaceae bacterium]|nr:hypothetical protein [Burkholderiaceae bacterium]
MLRAVALTSALTESAIAVDARFWPAVAEAARALAAHTREAAANSRDLRGLDVIVPQWTHAPILRGALHADFRRKGDAAFVPPRVQTLAAWAGGAWSGDAALARRVELFDALRANAWIRSAFGEQAAALWALARHIGAVCDELTFAAIDGVEAFEAQVRAALARHFQRRAAHALEPAAQLVLQLWRAQGRTGEGDPATARLAALRARIAATHRPVLVVAERVEPWLRAGLAALAMRAPVHLLRADFAAAIAAQPLLAAAWPEFRGAALSETPIAARARAVDPRAAETAPSLIEARSLEEEALAVAQHVEGWLRARGPDGAGSIALVALDRACARRVRALLERAQIQVRDETGWKLSTTSAAGAVMRLFDLTGNHCYYRDLLDWLKSPFSLHGEPHKAHGVEAIEKAIRRQRVIQGLGAIFSALAEAPGGAAT